MTNKLYNQNKALEDKLDRLGSKVVISEIVTKSKVVISEVVTKSRHIGSRYKKIRNVFGLPDVISDIDLGRVTDGGGGGGCGGGFRF